MEIRKSKSTNDATRHWTDTLREFLKEQNKPTLEEISDNDLAKELELFYISVYSKKSEKYKSTTLKAMRTALNCYFKDHCGVDIIQDKIFFRANELFLGLLKENKKEGSGQVTHKASISDTDKKLLFKYFEEKIKNPDPKVL